MPSSKPSGFKSFEKKFDDHVKENDERGARQEKFNSEVSEFIKAQLEFNKKIDARLERIESCPTIQKEITVN